MVEADDLVPLSSALPWEARASGETLAMTLHKLHSGDGCTYLTRQVAAGDEGRSPGQQLTDYHTASGNPPGRWVGGGAADLEVTAGVREYQMRALFGRGVHPEAEQIVALRPRPPPRRRTPPRR